MILQPSLRSAWNSHKPTFEQELGVFKIIVGIVLLGYPSARGLDALYDLYGVFISTQYFALLLILGGVLLLFLRRLPPLAFILVFLPTLFYSACLIPAALIARDIGPLGPLYTGGFCVLVLATYRRQLILRRANALLGLKD